MTISEVHQSGQGLWCWGCMAFVEYITHRCEEGDKILLGHCNCDKRKGHEDPFGMWEITDRSAMGVAF